MAEQKLMSLLVVSRHLETLLALALASWESSKKISCVKLHMRHVGGEMWLYAGSFAQEEALYARCARIHV